MVKTLFALFLIKHNNGPELYCLGIIYRYFLSGSSLSSPSIVFSYLWGGLVKKPLNPASLPTYIVNTMPPLSISLASRGTAPDQNVKMPSFLKILAAQAKLFLYSFLASIDCILFHGQLVQFTRETYRTNYIPGLNDVQRLGNIASIVSDRHAIGFLLLTLLSNQPDLLLRRC